MNRKLFALTGDAHLIEQLEGYFRALDELDSSQDLGLLTAAQSIELSEQFRSFHPLVRELQGVVLDDPNTSNHHVFLSRAPLTGAVLHLAHDGESRVVFSNLNSFLEAVSHAANAALDMEDEHPQHAWLAEDQGALRELIAALKTDPDGENILPALIPSLDLSDVSFLSTLIPGEDFYVAEAVFREIALRPTRDLLPVTKLGEEHPHPMVRNAAVEARARIVDL